MAALYFIEQQQQIAFVAQCAQAEEIIGVAQWTPLSPWMGSTSTALVAGEMASRIASRSP